MFTPMCESKMKALSVIIVSYKNIDIVCDCLDSISHYNDIGDELEVIISDNSEDNSLVEAIAKEYPWVKIIKNKNEGFGAGNNRGFEISTGKYLLFLNPDTILVEPIFKFAIDKFEKDDKLALCGVQLLNKSGSKNKSFFLLDRNGFIASICSYLCQNLGCYFDGKMFISGADLFVRRDSFIQAGMFDENIFMYNEEPDLIKRIKLNSDSKRTAFFRKKRIIHLEGGTEDSNIQSVISHFKRLYAADKYYMNKWGLDIKKAYKKRLRVAKNKRKIFMLLNRRGSISKMDRIIAFYSDILCDLTI